MARIRDHSAEAIRQNELARARGFRSRSEERQYSRRVANRRDWGALPSKAREQRRGALKAVSLMREDPSLGLVEAARQSGASPESVRWYAGEALARRGGLWQATAGDRLYRPMIVYSNGKTVAVDIRGSRKASEVSRYHASVRHYLETGNDSDLQRFAGKTVVGLPLETDLFVLEEMARRHQLDIESIYQLVVL